MSLRTFAGNPFRAWSFRPMSGAGIASRGLSSGLRQAGAVHLMTHKCDIERAELVNEFGVLSYTWNVSTENLACLVQEKKGGQVRAKDGRLLAYDAVAFVPIDTDVRPQGANDIQDRLVWLDIEPAVTFMVVLAVDESGMHDHLTVYLERLPNPAGTET